MPALKEAWVDWIQGLMPWDRFVSLTFRPLGNNPYIGWTEVGVNGAWGKLDRWLSGKEQGFYPHAVAVMEPHKDRISPHFHLLMMGEELERVTDWQEGYAKYDKVRGKEGVGKYVVKYVLKDNGRYIDNMRFYGLSGKWSSWDKGLTGD